MQKALTYDDIQLIPQYSEVQSRSNVDLITKLSKSYSIDTPIIASPMDTVCDSTMAKKLYDLGGVGCIHRFMSREQQMVEVKKVADYARANVGGPVMAAIGVKASDMSRAEGLVTAGANVLLIDVAHGDHWNVMDMIGWLKKSFPNVDVIAGNVATRNGALRLEDAGADAVRVGIGGGSLCTTRIKTGFGVPNVTAIEEIAQSSIRIPIIADGGIRAGGDIVKALAVGADTVMLGSLLAGTDEAPGKIIEKNGQLYKRYRGAASLETKTTHGQAEKHIEGESTIVPFKGGVKYIVSDLMDGVRSGLSYAGAMNLTELRANAKYNVVTPAGMAEGRPHLLEK